MLINYFKFDSEKVTSKYSIYIYYLILLYISSIFLKSSPAISNIAMGLILILSILSFKKNNISSSIFVISGFILFFIFQIISLIYTDNIQEGLVVLSLRLPLLLFSIAFIGIRFSKNTCLKIILFYSLVTTILSLVGFVNGLYLTHKFSDTGFLYNDNISALLFEKQAVFFGLYVNIAIYGVFEYLRNQPANEKLKPILYVSLVWLFFINFMLASKMAMFSLYAITGSQLLIHLIKKNKFKELLQDTTKYGLISIDRALFDELKSKYVTTFRYSNFDDSPYGEAYKKIMTVSLKAFLVASKNTPFRDKLNLLENLDKIKGDIPALHNKQFLSQFKEKNVKYESWWIIAIIVIFFFSFIIFHILLWIFSEVLRTIYFNKINDSAIHKIPKNDDYQETNDKKDIEDYSDKFYVYPVIIENQIAIVNRVVRALAFISKVRTEISNSFDRGWLKSSHYKFLIEKSDDITEKLRKTLAIRIHEIIERDERPLKTAQISREYLRKYLTADYLYQKDYEWLISKVDIKEVSTISKKLLIEMLSRALYKEAINLLINFFKTKDEKFVTERDKELYPEIILISAEFHTYTMEKNEFPEEYKRKIKITNHKLFDFIGRLENEKLLD